MCRKKFWILFIGSDVYPTPSVTKPFTTRKIPGPLGLTRQRRFKQRICFRASRSVKLRVPPCTPLATKVEGGPALKSGTWLGTLLRTARVMGYRGVGSLQDLRSSASKQTHRSLPERGCFSYIFQYLVSRMVAIWTISSMYID